MTVKDRLAELGIELPAVAAAAGSYLLSVQSGNLLFTAGQLPFVDGRLPATGRVGAEVSPEDAKEYARVCGLNLLAVIDAAVGLDKVERIVKVVGFVASAEGFTGQPGVINGVSDLLAEVFGESGRHARSAVGVAELPLGAPVEVEAIGQPEARARWAADHRYLEAIAAGVETDDPRLDHPGMRDAHAHNRSRTIT